MSKVSAAHCLDVVGIVYADLALLASRKDVTTKAGIVAKLEGLPYELELLLSAGGRDPKRFFEVARLGAKFIDSLAGSPSSGERNAP